jgi:hypothetical protein
MNLNRIIKSLLLFVSCVMIVLSCKSDRTRRSAGEFGGEETGKIIEKIEDIKKVYNLCPSPAEMLSIIEVAEMQFKTDLLNPTTNAEKYLDMRSLTLNLGIYVTDLAYAAIFGRREETINYLEIVQDIAEKIRITGTVNEQLIGRAKNNVNYIDSLFNISNEAFINMIFFCEKNDRPSTIMLISTGAFIESLYLAINMIEVYDTSDNMIRHLADQGYALDNLITSSESESADPNVSYALELLKPLMDIYEKIEVTGGRMTIRKEGIGKLVVGGKSKNKLSEQDFIKLKETAALIRNNIISNII